MTQPLITLDLLDKLVELGFTDEFFDIVHNFEAETIEHHRNYCLNYDGPFQSGGINEQTQKRLRIVLDAFVAGGFENKETFRFLAHAAAKEVPYREGVK